MEVETVEKLWANRLEGGFNFPLALCPAGGGQSGWLELVSAEDRDTLSNTRYCLIGKSGILVAQLASTIIVVLRAFLK